MKRRRKSDVSSLMDRTRAAVWINSTISEPGDAAAADMHAFMALFHPEVDQRKVRKMANEARERNRRH